MQLQSRDSFYLMSMDVVNSSLLHGSWQETVVEDNLFTRQEVIAKLDLLAQPRQKKIKADFWSH